MIINHEDIHSVVKIRMTIKNKNIYKKIGDIFYAQDNKTPATIFFFLRFHSLFFCMAAVCHDGYKMFNLNN